MDVLKRPKSRSTKPVLHGAVVQHITMDQEPSKEQMRTLIHEALIKQDLLNRKISLFDWNKTGFKEDITFGIKKPDDNGQLFFYYMTIHPDGTFDLLKSEAGLKRDHPLYRLQQALRISDSFTLKGSVQICQKESSRKLNQRQKSQPQKQEVICYIIYIMRS